MSGPRYIFPECYTISFYFVYLVIALKQPSVYLTLFVSFRTVFPLFPQSPLRGETKRSAITRNIKH